MEIVEYCVEVLLVGCVFVLVDCVVVDFDCVLFGFVEFC